MRERAGRATFVMVAVIATACAVQPAPRPNMTEQLGAPPSAVVASETPAPAEGDAVRFRKAFGLRWDPDWVRRVAADPSATRADFGLPLLLAERVALLARTRASSEAGDVIRTYGAIYPGEFAGVYTHPETGEIVALFTSHVAGHQGALRQLLRPDIPLEVRTTTFTLAYLDDLLSRISDGPEALLSLGARMTGAEVDIAANVVHVWIEGDDPALQALIHRRLGVGDELLVTSSLDPVAMLPRGSLVGQIVDQHGQPVREAGLKVEAVGSIGDAEPDGGVAYQTRADGSFVLPSVAAMTWTIRIHPSDSRLFGRVLGTATVEVTGGEAARVMVRVTGS